MGRAVPRGGRVNDVVNYEGSIYVKCRACNMRMPWWHDECLRCGSPITDHEDSFEVGGEG